jgi:hypothetical protein
MKFLNEGSMSDVYYTFQDIANNPDYSDADAIAQIKNVMIHPGDDSEQFVARKLKLMHDTIAKHPSYKNDPMGVYEEMLDMIRTEYHDETYESKEMNPTTQTFSEDDDTNSLEQWKADVRKQYPQQASQIKFKGKGFGDSIVAEIPGKDQAFGEFNMKTGDAWVAPMDEGVSEALDKEGDYHVSVQKGKFLPSDRGGGSDENLNYLHDLMNISGTGGGPMLVTISDPRIATEVAAMYGGTVLKTRYGTYRIVQSKGQNQKTPTPEPELVGMRESGVAEGAALPPEVIELIKKIAQSSATPEHKKATIDALVAKHSNQGVAEVAGDVNSKERYHFLYPHVPLDMHIDHEYNDLSDNDLQAVKSHQRELADKLGKPGAKEQGDIAAHIQINRSRSQYDQEQAHRRKVLDAEKIKRQARDVKRQQGVAEGSSSHDVYKDRLASIQSLRYDNPQEYAKQYRALLRDMPEEHHLYATGVQKADYSPGGRGSGTGRIGGVSEDEEMTQKKKEQVVTVKHKDSGKELRIVKTAVPDYQKRGYYPVKEQGVAESSDTDQLENWKAAVRKQYPNEAGQIKFKGKGFGDSIVAEIPGRDQAFGEFNMDTGEAFVAPLDESQAMVREAQDELEAMLRIIRK